MTVTFNATYFGLELNPETDVTFEMAKTILDSANTDSVVVEFNDGSDNAILVEKGCSDEMIFYAQYIQKDKFRRDGDKLACIGWRENGQKWVEGYCVRGELHRDGDKPAVAEWSGDGNIVNIGYYVHSEKAEQG